MQLSHPETIPSPHWSGLWKNWLPWTSPWSQKGFQATARGAGQLHSHPQRKRKRKDLENYFKSEEDEGWCGRGNGKCVQMCIFQNKEFMEVFWLTQKIFYFFLDLTCTHLPHNDNHLLYLKKKIQKEEHFELKRVIGALSHSVACTIKDW